jgi:hypothetical protein
MWAGLGFHSQTDGKFHIHGVTGPDEYTTIVDDNTYTNMIPASFLRRRGPPAESTDSMVRGISLAHGTGAGEAIRSGAGGMFIRWGEASTRSL